MYPYRFTNIHMFVQRVADNIVKYGYTNYVTGTIPEGRDVEQIDAKILERYGIAVSRWARARRVKAGVTGLHYVRHQRFFAMFAHSKGEHDWWQREEWMHEHDVRKHGSRIMDITRKPLVHGGYSISFKRSTQTGRGHVAVRIHSKEYRELKAYYLSLAVRRSKESLENEFKAFPFDAWRGVQEQRWVIFQAVNAARKQAGFELLEANRNVLRKMRIQHKLMLPQFSELSEREAA